MGLLFINLYWDKILLNQKPFPLYGGSFRKCTHGGDKTHLPRKLINFHLFNKRQFHSKTYAKQSKLLRMGEI